MSACAVDTATFFGPVVSVVANFEAVETLKIRELGGFLFRRSATE
jgi:hypothetical protein